MYGFGNEFYGNKCTYMQLYIGETKAGHLYNKHYRIVKCGIWSTSEVWSSWGVWKERVLHLIVNSTPHHILIWVCK